MLSLKVNSLTDIEAAIRILAILVGAVWVYFKFVRGRTFHPRLELTLTDTHHVHYDGYYVKISYIAKNIGLSRITISKVASGVNVYTAHLIRPRIVITPDWTLVASYPVFDNHSWIEPGEAISEERIIVIPDPKAVALRLELRVETRKSVWNAVTSSLLSDSEAEASRGTAAAATAATTRATATATATATPAAPATATTHERGEG